MIKHFFSVFAICGLALSLAGCSTNPATGEKQFTAFMSPAQENQIGAQEHQKIAKQYGFYKDQKLQNYVSKVGARVVQKTERPDVQYKFYLLDSPIVNAFALPGGYIYVSRGLLALANSEAELASVLGHEAGHITARHSAERYSHGVATSLGAMILSTAVGDSSVSEALGMGTNLYLSSYSRGQENQADSLGIRYLSHSGYDVTAMSKFLSNLNSEKNLSAKLDGRDDAAVASYFSTHPATADRVNKTVGEARSFIQGGDIGRDDYLKMIDGLVYGDSAAQGFVRKNTFYHPAIGFMFTVPDGYKIDNQASAVLATSKNGAAVIFDFAMNSDNLPPQTFLQDVWLKGNAQNKIENIFIQGMPAAATMVQGQLNGQDMNIQLIAIKWNDRKVVRFQIAMPKNLAQTEMKALKRMTYSFRAMDSSELKSVKPYRIKIIAAKAGDTIQSLSKKMAFSDYREERFRVLNSLVVNETIREGRLYKIIVE